ncbi:DUF3017 domain-containing protein [Streptomyces sp. NPDC052013]|uniref:DUF3017 domain-containing protein n=1 Tax=Streptomyces sp. NPDC052013 TaxID=3365679 RepID=UPI0037D3CA70
MPAEQDTPRTRQRPGPAQPTGEDATRSEEAPRLGTEAQADATESTEVSETRAGGEEAGGEEAGEGITVRDPVSAPDAEGTPRRTTRRFPLFTRDTARPEGGGRAAPGDAPAPARQWPILAVLLTVGLGLLLTALDVFRWGTLLIGAALLTGAALRWLVPDVGMLAVRSRFTDIVTYGVLGSAIVLLALMMQPDPLLELPFLKDTLHFTVSG